MSVIGFVNPVSAGSHERPQQAAGSLDPSFGTGGIVTTSFTGGADGQVVAQQSNGQLVVAGPGEISTSLSLESITVGQVARYNADGSLDTAFGTNGTVTINNFFPFAIALQSNGQIVLAGATENSKEFSEFGLVRLNTDGSADDAFGGGLVSTSFISESSDSIAFGMAVQPDGDIVAVGGVGLNLSSLSSTGIGVARYTSNGTLDPQFGTNGQTIINVNASSASSVLIQSDGAIVITGEAGGTGSILTFLESSQFLLVRLTSSGALDGTFGTEGSVQTKVGSGSVAYEAALQSDGDIVVAGLALVGLSTDIALARYNSNGTLDTTFGSGGTVTTNFDGRLDSASSISIQQDGEIVVGGMSTSLSTITDTLAPASTLTPSSLSIVLELFVLGAGSESVVARYDTDGSLDTSFGTNGVVTTLIDNGSGAFSVIIQSDGNIVAAGASLQSSAEAFAVSRYIAGPAAGEFTLSSNNSTQSVAAGSSVDFTISAASVSGSTPPTSSIALSAAVSPSGSGITTTFNPASVNAGSSSTLDVAAPSGTSPGQYTVTITGVAGSVTETTDVTVNVTAGPGFTMAFSTPTVTVNTGAKTTLTVEIERTGGLTGKVTVTAPATLPAGVSVKGATSVNTKAESASFTLKIKASAAAGTSQLTFTGTDKSGQTSSASIALIIQ
ncbi:MAG TPA: hypothetical protein VI756_12560 [Blastocatellia bacterium]